MARLQTPPSIHLVFAAANGDISGGKMPLVDLFCVLMIVIFLFNANVLIDFLYFS